MHFSKFAMAAAAALVLPAVHSAPAGTSSQYCQPHTASEAAQAEIFAGYVDAFYVRQNVAEAFHKYIEAGYIQHNAYSVGNGAASSEKQISSVWPQTNVTLAHVSYSHGLGWVHSAVQGGPMFPNDTAILDVYRFHGSCIIEHWDSIQPRNQNTVNPSFPL